MTNSEKLLEKIKSSEDRFVERKLNASKDEVCKALVAFANSLSESEEGFLFIGIADNGTIKGVENADKTQKNIRNWAEEVCYPSIKIQSQIIKEGIGEVIAITIYHSNNRPHFAGQAFVRVGSESKKASAELFEELITSRNNIAKRLLEAKSGKEILLVDVSYSYGGNQTFRVYCFMEECNPHYAVFKNRDSNETYSAALSKISISWAGNMNMLLITISS